MNIPKQNPYRCPMCGYTHKDQMIHMDHYICEQKGGPKMPHLPAKDRVRLSNEIIKEQSR